jgi:NTE family protein
MKWGTHDHTVLVLQGGGALGAYQAGVFEGLAEAGAAPDWIAGVSIGAINGALIAGNAPARRLERLREFWRRMSSQAPFMAPSALDGLRPLINRMNATSTLMFGVPGFFTPWQDAVSFYDTRPLKATLEELVDFKLINDGPVRLSLGSTHLRSGRSVYFDSRDMRIGPEHVLASGALPPGFPPVAIDGELYWDGGMVSNTPTSYVIDEDERINALIFQVDVFSGKGRPPNNLAEVQERAKDIQYSSKQRFTLRQAIEREAMRGTLRRVLDMLPEAMRAGTDVQRLAAVSKRDPLSLVLFINRHNTRSYEFKDYDFSRASIDELWQGGLADVRGSIAEPGWHRVIDIGEGVRVYDMEERL